MPYKDPEKEKASARRRAERYRERHPGLANEATKSWYQRNKERILARLKSQYDADPEKFRERSRRYRKAKSGGGKHGVRKARERSGEMAVTIPRCPVCKSAGTAKLSGNVYMTGCSNEECRLYVDGDESGVGTTQAKALEDWELKVSEEEAKLAETRKQLGLEEPPAEEEGGEAAAPGEDADPEPPPRAYKAVTEEEVQQWEKLRASGWSWRQLAIKFGRAESHIKRTLAKRAEEQAEAEEADDAEPPEEDAEGGKDAEDEEGEAAEEPSARFWLELDGKWYFLAAEEDEADGCAGCAFCFEFGRRKVCVASSSEDFREAGELCERLNGVWMEGEME